MDEVAEPASSGSGVTDIPAEEVPGRLSEMLALVEDGTFVYLHLVDGHGRALVALLSAGQANDAPLLPHLVHQLRVPRLSGGRPRTRPERLRGDKAYSSRAIRAYLPCRGITAVIPEPDDQIRHRTRRGSRGGRPPAFNAVDYHGRNVIERRFNLIKQWRGLATRYDKLATVYRAALTLHAVVTLSDTPQARPRLGPPRHLCDRKARAAHSEQK